MDIALNTVVLDLFFGFHFTSFDSLLLVKQLSIDSDTNGSIMNEKSSQLSLFIL